MEILYQPSARQGSQTQIDRGEMLIAAADVKQISGKNSLHHGCRCRHCSLHEQASALVPNLSRHESDSFFTSCLRLQAWRACHAHVLFMEIKACWRPARGTLCPCIAVQCNANISHAMLATIQCVYDVSAHGYQAHFKP